MTDIVKKKVCKCEKCGNEAEMVITCSLPEESNSGKTDVSSKSPDQSTGQSSEKDASKVKGTGVCSHCGNEADMWVDV